MTRHIQAKHKKEHEDLEKKQEAHRRKPVEMIDDVNHTKHPKLSFQLPVADP